MRRVGNYAINVIAIVLVTAVVLVFVLTRFGWCFDSVKSGSMEPKLEVGSLVVTQPVRTQDICIGNVIVFRRTVPGEQTSRMLVVHRVTDTGDGTWFQTKGDANEKADSFVVPAQDVLGRVCFHVPFLGRVLQLAKTPFGIALLVCCSGFLIVTDVIGTRRQASAQKKTGAAACRADTEGPNGYADRRTRRT